MKNNYENIETGNHAATPEDIFRGLDIPYSKSREEIWTALERRITDKPAAKISFYGNRRLILSVAAAFVLLAGIFSVLRFYTTSLYCPAGQHLSYQLPDGSKVEMNADSRISFKPLWWKISREVLFEGEGYFEVEKGKRFSVISSTGRTEVLGTSFNIYSRDEEYIVTCLTGQVRVVSFASDEVVLSPEYAAQIGPDGRISITKEMKAGESTSWINDMFSFKSRPLGLVLNEISRQYNVKIYLKTNSDYLYTGYFTKNRPLEETLSLICTPFGLTFARVSENEYEITQN